MKDVAKPKVDEVFYKKVGNRYVPVKTDFNLHGFSKGHYRVTVGKGSISMCRMADKKEVDETLLLVQSVLYSLGDELSTMLYKLTEARPMRKDLTLEQKQLWEKLKKSLGEEAFYIQYDSCRGIIDNLMDAIAKKVSDIPRTIDSGWL